MSEQHEGHTRVGTEGLSYGTELAEEMIRIRIKKLEEKGTPGIPADRRTAINQLAHEGNLKTLEDVGTDKPVYLGDDALREAKAKAVQSSKAPASHEAAKEEAKKRAKERGISYREALSELMNERAKKGEVNL